MIKYLGNLFKKDSITLTDKERMQVQEFTKTSKRLLEEQQRQLYGRVLPRDKEERDVFLKSFFERGEQKVNIKNMTQKYRFMPLRNMYKIRRRVLTRGFSCIFETVSPNTPIESFSSFLKYELPHRCNRADILKLSKEYLRGLKWKNN